MSFRRILSKPKTPPAKIPTTVVSKLATSKTEPPLTKSQLIYLIHASKTTKHLQQLHAQTILHNKFSNSRVTTQLITTCSNLKSINYALSIFSALDNPNIFLFNNLIRALTDNSYFMSSISYFLVMLSTNIRPNRLTFPSVLKSSAALLEGGLGREIHVVVVKMGFEFDLNVRISLVDMYVKVDLLGSALRVFDESPDRNEDRSVLLWNILINGYSKVGRWGKAVELFETMPVRSSVSWNSLVNGLMRNGEWERALELFYRAPEKDVVLWTTMIHGFLQNGNHEKALSMFFQMLEDGVRPNDVTVVSALLACTKVGALETGKRIHKFISRCFKLNRDVGTALVDMYVKCGSTESATRVFAKLKEKDIRTWTVMIWGWAIHGHVEQALQCFKQMKSAGIKPDEVVFVAILTAFLHAGKVDQGLQFFDTMRIDYSMDPTMKHYAVIVDLFGRAGRLDDALSFIENMPLDPDFVIWGALFCACKAHKNIKMAEYASERLLELEPELPGSCNVFLSNIYAAVGSWEDLGRLRTIMKSRGVKKDTGRSYIEIEGKVNSFVAGDHAHAFAKEIYTKLEEISTSAREQGYMPETEWVFRCIEEEEKEDACGSHSERLALALGLICAAPGMAIRIVKTQRVCRDCHSMMKYTSKMTRREIVLRDINRFHYFKDGTCSCQDHW